MDARKHSDLIHLDGPLTADAILKCIQQRFLEQKSVTWLGPIMVYLNTYTPFSSTTQALRQFCRCITEDMAKLGKNQAVILNGLSGSGKTHLANQLVPEIGTCVSGPPELIKNLMMAQIVLKAMGTANTVSNKDSSRLGKVIDFGIQNRTLVRVKFNCFYLDQSRLVSPNRFEGNYNVFYQLLAGLTPEERAKLNLQGVSWQQLHYLSQACPPKEDDSKLAQSFELWKTGLAKLGIPLNDILHVLVATLLLGNISFYGSKSKKLEMTGGGRRFDPEVKIFVNCSSLLTTIATLLGVQPSSLEQGLSMRTYISGQGQAVKTSCSAAGANGARDALAKALYVRTLVAIVRRINNLLRPLPQVSPQGVQTVPHVFEGGVSTTEIPGHGFASPTMLEPPHLQQPSASEVVLSVVDMFGFERHEANGLEQFCINWTAESLNRHFCASTFSTMYEECQLDGVDPLIECDVYDSVPCLDLLGNHRGGGMLELINQETLSPRVQSDDICTRLKQRFQGSSCLLESRGSAFTIQHFVEEVAYDIIALLNANADTLADDVVSVFSDKECTFGFVTHLFSHELNHELVDGVAQGNMCRITPPSILTKGNATQIVTEPTTFVQDFQMCVSTQLLVHLNSCKPHFVRCIRGNNMQRPGEFSRKCIAQQLKCLSVLETLDQYMNGFSTSYALEEFVRQFWMLAPQLPSSSRKQPNEMCRAIMRHVEKSKTGVEVSEEMWAIGRAKIFINEELQQIISLERSAAANRAAVRIQSWVRRHLALKNWPKLRLSLQQVRQQRGLGQNQQHPGLDRSAYDSLPVRIPPGRNYTVVGSLKVMFPQWRVMKSDFPDSSAGPPMLTAGQAVFVKGRSPQRGFLLVDNGGQQLLIPHYYTELRLPQLNAPPGNGARVGSKTSDL